MVKEDISIFLRVCFCAAYGGSSNLLTFVNRILFQAYNYRSPLSLLFVQCVFNIFICLILMSIKQFVTTKAFDNLETYGIKFSTLSQAMGKVKAGIMISGVRVIEVLFGLYSLKAVNIPLFLTIRRCNMITTIIVNYLYQGAVPNQTLIFAAFLVSTGAIIAGYETFDDDYWGYVLIMCNNFGTAFVNVVASVYNDKKVVNAFDLNFYFAVIGLPLSLAITQNTGEFPELMSIMQGGDYKGQPADPSMRTYIMISGSFGIVITMAALLCTTINGPIAMNITGIFKDVLLTWAGFLFFSDTKSTPSNLFGMTLSFIGASYYCYHRYQDAKSKEAAAAKVKTT